ncbi:hypothetical protein SLEP1_g52394 [Rubroshorea leprosula]|uniref:Uncharacterized protein n=1 Tax=Rubroshorea leprosula TaxID=152421 RepID=A0AAV5M648_9ROSI|nr:hypothetical protein SLEP1_g52394 [Rubroshorea leprosula]
MNNTIQVRIDGWIQGLPAETSWPKIFQVPRYLRELNEEAYEPTIISIGPYHRQKDHLKAMETHKVRFLKDLLQRRNENSAQRYVEAMTDMKERARKCYSESLVISDEEFLETMVLDGCFIVELIHKIKEGSCQQDSILNVSQIFTNIVKDLILVENQLPFFVLWEFLGNAFEDRFRCIDVIIGFFEVMMPGLTVRLTYDENSIKKVKHLLDLLRTNWIPSDDTMHECKNVQEMKFIRSATELREAGIKFRRGKGRNLFDIKFENGTLYIPALNLEDHTERLYCNIVACEQFADDGSPEYLTKYITVMDCLIDTGKDVELLFHKGIMHHWLGTDEAAAKIFNRLGTEVIVDRSNFFYAKLFNDVNRHYYNPWNKRVASLRHNYFNTPWALISFLAASFLLLLTLLQTTFTVFPRS